MVREIRRNKLELKLAAHDWAGFARGYNGPGYAQNAYDTKLAAAYRKWLAAVDPNDPETGEEPIDIPETKVPEKPSVIDTIKDSKIAKAGVVVETAVTGELVTQVTDAAANVKTIKGAAEDVGILDTVTHLMQSPRFWIAVAVIVIIAGIIYWRWRDHAVAK